MNSVQKALLELVKVTRRFASGDKDAVALNNIMLRICAGEFVAIMGASGSGKSTLMNILAALIRPVQAIIGLAGGKPRRSVRMNWLSCAARVSALFSSAITCCRI